MSRLNRRQFLEVAAAGTVSLSALVRTEKTPKGSHIPRRPLGATGLEVSILGLGCATIGYGRSTVEEGASIVEACIEGGITYIDCASSYGDAEEKVGRVMRSRRKEVVLATKTLERGKEASWREINRSLERLQTDSIDLLQIHAVNSISDLRRVLADDGSLSAAIRAREEGMCAHIGITGHARPEVIASALAQYPFATALTPLSSTDALMNDFGPVIFPLASERGFGVIAMKVLAAGRVMDHPAESIRYSLSLPVSTAVVGMGSLREVQENIATVAEFEPMNREEMKRLEEKTRLRATTDVLWWKRV